MDIIDVIGNVVLPLAVLVGVVVWMVGSGMFFLGQTDRTRARGSRLLGSGGLGAIVALTATVGWHMAG